MWSNVLAVWLKCRWVIVAALVGWMFAQGHSHAQQTPDPAAELHRQQERTQAHKRMLESAAGVRSEIAKASSARLPLGESPCFVIKYIELQVESRNNERQDFDWLADFIAGPSRDDSPLGRCLGANGVGVVLKRAQDAVVAKGFVTTRVLAKSQDLSSGILVLTVIPGRVNVIRSIDTSAPTVLAASSPEYSEIGFITPIHGFELPGTKSGKAEYALPWSL